MSFANRIATFLAEMEGTRVITLETANALATLTGAPSIGTQADIVSGMAADLADTAEHERNGALGHRDNARKARQAAIDAANAKYESEMVVVNTRLTSANAKAETAARYANLARVTATV